MNFLKTYIYIGFLVVTLLLQSCSSTKPTPSVTQTAFIVASTPSVTATPVVIENTYTMPASAGPVDIEAGNIKVTPNLINNYLANPGMGWQDGPEPFGILGFPETVDYSYRRKISWVVLNPSEGVYDWSALDNQLTQAILESKQFSFRVYTMVGEDYDGEALPDWVITKGASLFPNGEPDYSNCVYQEEWGKFVDELIKRYDGNSDVAFIDISGYGNFNEWSWEDQQTEWDDDWDNFENGGTSFPQDYFKTMDGQARRRLADMFIGGGYQKHQCRNADGSVSQVEYSYQGFQKTQLVMPYAGIVQSSEYVFSRRKDVGFRYDCLGYKGEHVFEKINLVLSEIWKTAPVAFELCKPDDVEAEDAKWLLETSHGSIVHNNNWEYDIATLEDVMRFAGYRYFLKEANISIAERNINVNLHWENVGLAPSYPKMGQTFQLKIHILDSTGQPVVSNIVPVDISTWLPSNSESTDLLEYPVEHSLQLPAQLPSGVYLFAIEIVDLRTEKSILLPFNGRDENGLYVLTSLEIE